VQLDKINDKLKERNVVLREEGDHSFSFTYDNGRVYSVHKVHLSTFNQMDESEWIKEGTDFADKVDNHQRRAERFQLDGIVIPAKE
jgi:hypothetical protein